MSMKGEEWLTSVEVRKALKISTCDLAHLREDGTIHAVKRGNAYHYAATDVELLRGRELRGQTDSCSPNERDR